MLTAFSMSTRNKYTNIIERSLRIAINDPDYIVRNITGLGPVKADLAFLNRAADSGRAFLNSRVPARDIVITLEMRTHGENRYTAEELRQKIYHVGPPRTPLELDFETDTQGIFKTMGYVEDVQVVHFSKEPVVALSIMSPDAYFFKDEPPVTFALDTANAEEFSIPFLGNVPVGFKMQFDVEYARSGGAMILSQSATPDFYLSTVRDLSVGDRVLFSSLPGERYARHRRSSSTKNDLGMFRGSLVDAKLYPGANHFRFRDGLWMKDIFFTYNLLYEGL